MNAVKEERDQLRSELFRRRGDISAIIEERKQIEAEIDRLESQVQGVKESRDSLVRDAVASKKTLEEEKDHLQKRSANHCKSHQQKLAICRIMWRS